MAQRLDFLTEVARLPLSGDADTKQCMVAAILTAAIVIGNDLYASVPLALEKYKEVLCAMRDQGIL